MRFCSFHRRKLWVVALLEEDTELAPLILQGVERFTKGLDPATVAALPVVCDKCNHYLPCSRLIARNYSLLSSFSPIIERIFSHVDSTEREDRFSTDLKAFLE
jgi:hypothetical protein